MRHPFFASSRPRVFAHRGGSALAPENTFAAFDRALELGADGLELDVHLSRDGVPVVHHDALLDRTTNLRGPIGAHDAADLVTADAGWNFRLADELPFRGKGIGVPPLAEVLARYPGIPIIVELKSDQPELARVVVDLVQSHRAADRVCIAGFAARSLKAVRTLAPTIATSAARPEVAMALLRTACRWPWWRVDYAGFQVPERSGRLRVVTPRFVAAAHRAKLGVQVWVVDRPDEARRLLGYGADALITDRPDVIVPVVRAAS